MIRYIVISIVLSASCSVGSKRYSRNYSNFYSSLVLTGYGSASYKGPSVDAYLDELKLLKANTASFLYTCFVRDKFSSQVFCDSYNSPRFDQFMGAIDRAKQSGLAVAARFYIDISDGMWRCSLSPLDSEFFFKTYKENLMNFAISLEHRSVEMLIVGAELCNLTDLKFKEDWKELIKEIRTVYSGKITYGANWDYVNGKREIETVSFWDFLDYVGVDQYMALSKGMSKFEFYNMQQAAFRDYVNIAKKYNKKLIVTEVGYPGTEHLLSAPYNWKLTGRSDEELQAFAYEKTFNAIKENPNIEGVFVWRKLDSSPEDMKTYKPNETSYELYMRKAWYVLKSFFGEN